MNDRSTNSSTPISPVASRLLEAGATHPAIRDLGARLTAAPEGASVRLRGVAGSAGALVAALLGDGSASGADGAGGAGGAGGANRPLAIIAPDLDRAEAWRDDLSFFLGPDRVVFIPPQDTVPWSSQTATAPVREDRLHAFLRLGDPHPPVAVIPALALHRLAPPPALVRTRSVDVAPGLTIAPETLLHRLVLAGYRSVVEIGESGEVSRRGGIVDVFGPGMETPARIEFDGDTVASLRSFDVTSQRSTGSIDRIRVIPARELLYREDTDARLEPLDAPQAPRPSETDRIRDLVAEGIYFEGMEWIAPLLGIPLGSVLDYLPPGTTLWIDEPAAVEREVETAEREAVRLEPVAREKASHL